MATKNTYEAQSKLGVALAGVSGLCALAAAAMVVQAFDWTEFETVMRQNGTRFFAILGAVVLAMLAGAVGFLVSFNSAGQKRNSLSRLAWTGFFANAAVITLTMWVFVFFWFTKYLAP